VEHHLPLDRVAQRELLGAGLSELGQSASESQLDLLLGFLEMLCEWGSRMNLTAHRTPDAVIRRLLLDAAALGAEVGETDSLADIGSGAGLPGIPLAILRPDCRVSLIEPRLKRHHFQRAVVRELGLVNVDVMLGRSESLDPIPHSAVVGQALAQPDQALEWMIPWAAVGGGVWLPGSDDPSPVAERPDTEFVVRHRYRVPLEGAKRTVWVGRRTR
jgi:16S rRNA (guanine527-N7)-methyltransferase